MRKITSEAVDKFLSKTPFRKSNMSVEESYGVYKLKLHGNTIATIDELGVLLNGIPGVRVHQKNWNWFLNGVEWDGSWKRISVI